MKMEIHILLPLPVVGVREVNVKGKEVWLVGAGVGVGVVGVVVAAVKLKLLEVKEDEEEEEEAGAAVAVVEGTWKKKPPFCLLCSFAF